MAQIVERLKSWWESRRPRDVSKCLLVEWDDVTVRVRVLEAFDDGWNQEFPWREITRVCFSDGGISMSDVVHLEIRRSDRPAVVLTEARGGPEFMAELLKRDLFPQEVLNNVDTIILAECFPWRSDHQSNSCRVSYFGANNSWGCCI